MLKYVWRYLIMSCLFFSRTFTTSRATWQLHSAHMSPSWFLACRGPETTPKSRQVSQNLPYLCSVCEQSFKCKASLRKCRILSIQLRSVFGCKKIVFNATLKFFYFIGCWYLLNMSISIADLIITPTKIDANLTWKIFRHHPEKWF